MRITVDNVMDVIKDYDLVVDGSDNFETRYLVNDACYLAGKTQRARLDLPVRGHGHGVRAEQGAVLSLPLSRRRRRRASSPPEARLASWACSQE